MSRHVMIIAEAGVNHCGRLDLALQLVDEAAKAGADVVKFQTFRAEQLVTPAAAKAEYQKVADAASGDSQLEMLRALELSDADHLAIIERCRQRGIMFLSTAFDLPSVEFLKSLDMPIWKIPSGEVTNVPYLRAVASAGKPIIMSTGMCSMAEVKASTDILIAAGVAPKNITLLHCTTQYPTPMADVNLRAMPCLLETGCGAVGYSDHTRGIEVAVAAVALGATVIEKHFTLDRNLPGPDHKASLTPDELARMVSSIRNIEAALGDEVKECAESERANKAVARKSIVAACDIKAGTLFTAENLTVKRPGTGLSPMKWDQVVGQIATRDFAKDSLIEI